MSWANELALHLDREARALPTEQPPRPRRHDALVCQDPVGRVVRPVQAQKGLIGTRPRGEAHRLAGIQQTARRDVPVAAIDVTPATAGDWPEHVGEARAQRRQVWQLRVGVPLVPQTQIEPRIGRAWLRARRRCHLPPGRGRAKPTRTVRGLLGRSQPAVRLLLLGQVSHDRAERRS